MKPSYTPIRLIAVACLAFALGSTAQAQRGAAPPEPLSGGPWDFETETGPIHVSILTNQLESPWSLAFLPDGDMLLTERPGRLRVIRDGELDPTPIAGLPEMFTQSISGLFDVVLHPEFEDNRLIYFHKNSLVDGAFGDLRLHDKVALVVGGDDSVIGPHASTVRSITALSYDPATKPSRR